MDKKCENPSIYQKLITLMMRAKRQMFRVCEKMQLTPVQGMLLISLVPETSKTMQELACMMGCDASNITGLIDKLESGNYIERTADTRDRRVKKIQLSAEGIRCRNALLDALHEAEVLDVSKLTEDEVKALHSITAKLV
jgi:DNA-binding MarR family transcriptional regulator